MFEFLYLLVIYCILLALSAYALYLIVLYNRLTSCILYFNMLFHATIGILLLFVMFFVFQVLYFCIFVFNFVMLFERLCVNCCEKNGGSGKLNVKHVTDIVGSHSRGRRGPYRKTAGHS